MRIIAGQWRGRKIAAPEGETTRPTTDRVREALFSMLASRLGSFEDLRIADLFAGSGALGLEALSRGAAHCTFVEQDPAAIKALQSNVAELGANADIQRVSAERLNTAQIAYDVIVMDPPYDVGWADKILPVIMSQNWLTTSSWVSIETEKSAPIEIPGLSIDTVRIFGKAQVTLLRLTESV